MGCIIWWDPDVLPSGRPVPRMSGLRELLDAIRGSGRTAVHDWRDNAWGARRGRRGRGARTLTGRDDRLRPAVVEITGNSLTRHRSPSLQRNR